MKLFHITSKANLPLIKKYGLVGSSKAKHIIEEQTGERPSHFNNKVYELLKKCEPPQFDIYGATFMYSKQDELEHELLTAMKGEVVVLQIDDTKLNSEHLFVFNSVLPSRLLNYSDSDRELIARLYYETAIPYKKYLVIAPKVEKIFKDAGVFYLPEYVYFDEISYSCMEVMANELN